MFLKSFLFIIFLIIIPVKSFISSWKINFDNTVFIYIIKKKSTLIEIISLCTLELSKRLQFPLNILKLAECDIITWKQRDALM